jgi:hypothetical protein
MSARSFDMFHAKKYGNVRVKIDESTIKVQLHQTDVVTYFASLGEVKLNTNGWHTVTTKTAMNNALGQLGLDIRVYQDKGNWFVKFGEEILDFVDNMLLTAIKRR